jgi:hypothetical protein
MMKIGGENGNVIGGERRAEDGLESIETILAFCFKLAHRQK